LHKERDNEERRRDRSKEAVINYIEAQSTHIKDQAMLNYVRRFNTNGSRMSLLDAIAKEVRNY